MVSATRSPPVTWIARWRAIQVFDSGLWMIHGPVVVGLAFTDGGGVVADVLQQGVGAAPGVPGPGHRTPAVGVEDAEDVGEKAGAGPGTGRAAPFGQDHRYARGGEHRDALRAAVSRLLARAGA